MNTLVVYDSQYGNTEKIAKAIEQSAHSFGKTRLLLADEFKPGDMVGVNFLFIGSPTQGGLPTPAVKKVIESFTPASIKDVSVAVFDTRFDIHTQGFWLRTLMKIIGFAAPKMAANIKKRSGKLVGKPQGFIVEDTKGPVTENELARAADWAKEAATRGSA